MIEALIAPPASTQQPLSDPSVLFARQSYVSTMSPIVAAGRAVAFGLLGAVPAGFAADWTLEATKAIETLSTGDLLANDRLAECRRIVGFLQIWDAQPPSEIGDTSDADFSLVWRQGGLAASLVVSEDEVLGYAFRPGMREPWVFAQPRIGVADLNAFARKVGSARAEGLGRP